MFYWVFLVFLEGFLGLFWGFSWIFLGGFVKIGLSRGSLSGPRGKNYMNREMIETKGPLVSTRQSCKSYRRWRKMNAGRPSGRAFFGFSNRAINEATTRGYKSFLESLSFHGPPNKTPNPLLQIRILA